MNYRFYHWPIVRLSLGYVVMLDKNEKELSLLYKHVNPTVEFNKLRKRLLRNARKAIEDFGMLEIKGRWLVALSGGKDSFGLLAILLELKWLGLLNVELIACNLEQGQPNFPKYILPDYLENLGVEYHIEYRDTYSIVKEKLQESQTYCSLCSRLRRGYLYKVAREKFCSALILGHHRDDVLETFFLNLFHGGRLASMPAKLLNDEKDVFVLRPLIYVTEDDLKTFAKYMQFPIIPCNLCGSQDGLQRNVMKKMLNDIETRMPGRKDVMIKALSNVRASHLLDPKLFDFKFR